MTQYLYCDNCNRGKCDNCLDYWDSDGEECVCICECSKDKINDDWPLEDLNDYDY